MNASTHHANAEFSWPARGGQFLFLAGQPGYITPTAIDNPYTLLSQWKQAAVNAKEAGFDGVEIHGAYGYLIHQFLDSTSIERTDEWGGSVQNRVRFTLEVVKIAADIWGAERVGIKLNPVAGYNDIGHVVITSVKKMPLQETLDTFRYLISELDSLGTAYVALVRYAESLDPVIDGTRRGTKQEVLGTYALLVKNPATKVFANASFTGEEASLYVEDGKVDGVFFGILWVANPDFAKRLEKGETVEENVDFMTLAGHGGLESDERNGYVGYPAAVF
ncbi:hypothetical protein EV421DRAFT_1912261 [Armillaria borealis]|uniref:NADH:flavin oxidoreductase/NADH oxidase N-terminal domain-containing protein n=1 Tax=Armillaria borealis TaxID=47425 RepID=A0AA39IWV7_9AGAR|nr:hypothetical protein EV421DRAFT_1912261 [Armillaria borealis]